MALETSRSRVGEPDLNQADAAATVDGLVPPWFDVAAVAGPIILLAVGCAALVLAMADHYSMGLALAIGVPLGGAAVLAVGRILPRPSPGPRASQWWAVGAVAIAVTAFAWNGLHPAQHVIVEADPGGYSATARWIARDGSLVGDLPADPFLEQSWASVEVPGVYDVGDGEVEFQFNHLTAAALAVTFDAGGTRAMFRLPALAGALALLPLYSVMVRLGGRPWLGVVGVLALATSLPFIAFSRDTYSEPFALALVWSGVLLLALTATRRSPTLALLAGSVLGGASIARIDGVVYLIAVPFVAAWLAYRRSGACALMLLGGSALTYLLGAADLWLYTGRYASALASSRLQLDLLLGIAFVIAGIGYLVMRFRLGWSRCATALADRAATPAVVAVVVVGFALWLVRPQISTVRMSPVQWWGDRTFAEDSVHWLAWYLGPATIVLAIVGLALATSRVLRRTADKWVAILLLTVVPSTAIYLWRPSITPTHIWAMRRYLPAVLPGVLALAVIAVAWILGSRFVRALPTIGRAVVVGAVVVALGLPPMAATWPVRDLQERRGYLLGLERACELVGDDAAVLVFAGGAWTQSMRSWCGVPAAWADLRKPPSSAELDELAEAWAQECRRLVLLADDETSISRYLREVEPFEKSIPVGSNRSLEITFERRPSHYRADPSQLTLAKSTVVPSCSDE